MQEKKTNTSHFDFLPSGYFTLLTPSGIPYYDLALPLVRKILSHCLYIILWASLTTFFSNTLLFSLIIIHLFFIGCRLTTLLLHGNLKYLIFPPLEIRLSRKIAKSPSYTHLLKHNLENHPGLLSNLSIAYFTHKDLPNAKKYIELAQANSSHPHLQSLATLILTHNE